MYNCHCVQVSLLGFLLCATLTVCKSSWGRAGHFPRRGTVPDYFLREGRVSDHFPREGRSLPSEGHGQWPLPEGGQVTFRWGAWSMTTSRGRAGHFPVRGTVNDHFPREGRSLPQEGPLHQKGPYLKLPEKDQNVLSGAVIPFIKLGHFQHWSFTQSLGFPCLCTAVILYTLKNSALYLRVISMSYCCKSWQLFEPNVQNYFELKGLK